MDESRKNLVIEKLAARRSKFGAKVPGKGHRFNKDWAKTFGKELTDPKALGGGLRNVLGKGAALGAGVLAAKYLIPKKTLAQKMIGEGTAGRRALMFGAGAVGLGAGLKGIESLGDAISTPLKKKKYFNNMLDENPSLKKENPKDVSKIFRTLYTFNPLMASDPLVAGSFLKRSLQFKDEGIQPVDVKTLTEIGKHLRESKKKDTFLRSAFASTGSELMGFSG